MPFFWKDSAGNQVALSMMSIAYKGATGYVEGDRLAAIAMIMDDVHMAVALVDCEYSISRRSAVISLPQDNFLKHNELTAKFGVTPNFKLLFPFSVSNDFRKTDLSQVTLAVFQAALEKMGIDKVYVWEDATLKGTNVYPFVQSAYFKYSRPISEFKPAGSSSYPGWPKKGSGHVYAIPTKLTYRQILLLNNAFQS